MGEGLVSIITGGTDGIGRGIARAVAQPDAIIILAARGAEKLEAASEELSAKGASVRAVQVDLSTPEGTEQLITVARQYPTDKIVFYSNAGVYYSDARLAGFVQSNGQHIRDQFLHLHAETPRRFLEEVKPKKAVMVLSTAALALYRGGVEYAAAKRLAEIYALHAVPLGVDARFFYPGNSMTKGASELDDIIPPEDRMAPDMVGAFAVQLAQGPEKAMLLVPKKGLQLQTDLDPESRVYKAVFRIDYDSLKDSDYRNLYALFDGRKAAFTELLKEQLK